MIDAYAMGAHGDRLMLIWGDHYREPSSADLAKMNTVMTPDQKRALIRNRILALTEYIASIQAQ